MISENLVILRKKAGFSQETLAEKIGVSRQTLAKWENGESVPDVLHCDRIAQLFEISLDDLLHSDFCSEQIPAKGKYVFGMVTVGDKGQIVIPVKARRVFNIKPGDNLMVLGDEDRGIALLSSEFFLEVAKQVQQAQGGKAE